MLTAEFSAKWKGFEDDQKKLNCSKGGENRANHLVHDTIESTDAV